MSADEPVPRAYRAEDRSPEASFERRLLRLEAKLVLMEDKIKDVHEDANDAKHDAMLVRQALAEETTARSLWRDREAIKRDERRTRLDHWLDGIRTALISIAIVLAAVWAFVKGGKPL